MVSPVVAMTVRRCSRVDGGMRPPPARRPAATTTSDEASPAAERGLGGERGSVSIEAALVMVALVVVLAIVLGGVALMTAQVRCVDAAREAARLVARGESARAGEAARRLAPSGAHVAVRIEGDEVVVAVSADPLSGVLGGLTVHADAVAVLEPGVAAAP